MKTWDDIRSAVLDREPKAGPLLDVIERHWGDGRLTEDIARRFIEAMAAGNYVEARKLLYASSTAAQLIDADWIENERLRVMIEQETKLHDFLRDLQAAALKVALGVALAAVGL